MKIVVVISCLIFCCTGVLQAQNRVAGTLYLALDVTNIAAAVEGDVVSVWPNKGMGGLADFVPAVTGKGALYRTNYNGAPALVFDGSLNSVMVQQGYLAGSSGATDALGVPAALLGTNTTWSVEVWAHNAGSSSIETLVAWTSRRFAANYAMMEVRWGSDVNNCVEHYARNLGWGGALPQFDRWHHITITRTSAGLETLYVDGRAVSTLDMSGAYMLNLQKRSAIFGVGAVDTGAGWDYRFSGGIAVVRVHGGTLSADDVQANFKADIGRFGGVWKSATRGSWDVGENWVGDRVPIANALVAIDNGGTPQFSSGTVTNTLYALNGGLDVLGGTFYVTPYLNNNRINVGVGSGSSFAWSISNAVVTTLGNSCVRLGDASASGSLRLDAGGRLVTRYLERLGTGTLYVNGGYLQGTETSGTFVQNLTSAQVGARGLGISAPAGVTLTVPQRFVEDPGNPGGGITKQGAGTVIFTGSNAVTGPISVEQGSLLFQAAALSNAWNSSASLSGNGSLGWEGHVATLAQTLQANAQGYLYLFPSDATANVTCAAGSSVGLRPVNGVTYTGTYLPSDNVYRFYTDSGTNIVTQSIAAGSVVVEGLQNDPYYNGSLFLSGNSLFTGGVTVNSGIFGLLSTNGFGLSGDVVFNSGTVFRLQSGVASDFFTSRFKATQGPVSVQIANGGLTNTLDLTTQPNVWIGGPTFRTRQTFAGTIIPYNNTYQLGNTGIDLSDEFHGLLTTGLTDAGDGTPRRVWVSGKGVANVDSSSFSGGTRIDKGGKLMFSTDTAFGRIPSAFEANHVVVSNGTLRTLTQNISLHAHRGFRFDGPFTNRIHASGSLPAQLVFNGSISGTSALRLTDIGYVVFAGTNNTWNGTATLDNGGVATLVIGNGTNFSWNSTGGIVGSSTRGALHLNTDTDVAFSDTFSGKGVLVKRGTGCVTLNAAFSHKELLAEGFVQVENGGLRYGVSNALASGAGAGNIAIKSAGFIDLNGYNATWNGVIGSGLVTNSAVQSVTLTVGYTNVNPRFDGTFARGITLEKVNTNALTLGGLNAAYDTIQLKGGALVLDAACRVLGGVTQSAGTLLRVNGSVGLRAEYFDNSTSGTGGTWSESGRSLSELNTYLTRFVPTLVTDCSSFGSVFDSTASGINFPSVYSNTSSAYFTTRWTGRFYAAKEGIYTFDAFADDGCFLYLDGTQVVNNQTGSGSATGSANLTAGWHDMTIFFYERDGVQAVRVEMTPPGGSRAYLPLSLLSLGDEGTYIGGLSAAAGAQWSIASNAWVVVNQTNSATVPVLSGTVGGRATVIKKGAGSWTLQSANTYDGRMILQAGSTTLPAANLLPASVMLDGGTFMFNTASQVNGLSGTTTGLLRVASSAMVTNQQNTAEVFQSAVLGESPSTVFAKTGDADWTVAGDWTQYSGRVNVVKGRLIIADGAAFGTNIIDVVSGAEVLFTNASPLVFSARLSGTGSVRVSGSGKVTFTSVPNGLVVDTGSTVELNASTFGEAIAVNGALTNRGTVVFSGAGSYLLGRNVAGSGRFIARDGATVRMADGLSQDAWVTLGSSSLIVDNGRIEMPFVADAWAYMCMSNAIPVTNVVAVLDGQMQLTTTLGNLRSVACYRRKVQTAQPFVLDLTFRGYGGGDGFAVLFHTDSRGPVALPSGWYQGVSGLSPDFGFQYYLMAGNAYFAWVDNGAITAWPSVASPTGSFGQKSGALFTARLSYDGTTMISEFWQSGNYAAMTNSQAGVKLRALGDSAYLGLFGGTGGLTARQVVETLSFVPQTSPSTAAMSVEVEAGKQAVLAGASTNMTLTLGDIVLHNATRLTIDSGTDGSFRNLINAGASELVLSRSNTLTGTGTNWLLTTVGAVQFSGTWHLPEQIYVRIAGVIPETGSVVVADFTGASLVRATSFIFDDTEQTGARLFYVNDQLRVTKTRGSLLMLK